MDKDSFELFGIEEESFKPAVDRKDFSTLSIDPKEHIEGLAHRRDTLSPFGIRFLDENLGGVSNEDLIVIGAGTGVGKTQLAMMMGLHAATHGRKVDYFALEAYPGELRDRMIYRTYAKLFYEGKRNGTIAAHEICDPQDYLYGEYVGKHDDLITKAVEAVAEIKNFNTFYPKEPISIERFKQIFVGIASDTDLVIVDHLHYFEHEDENENRAIKTIVSTLRKLVVDHKKPIVLVSHVRKRDRKNMSDVPLIDDLHGSSEISKMATKVITFGRYYSDELGDDYTCVVAYKNRFGGNRVCGGALVSYDPQKQTYANKYILGKAYDTDGKFKKWDVSKMGAIPHWAKSIDVGTGSVEGVLESTPGPNYGKSVQVIKQEGKKYKV